jgi:hypothetical protein
LVKNIRIIANVDHDRFHVLIGRSHQHITKTYTFCNNFSFSKLQDMTKMILNLLKSEKTAKKFGQNLLFLAKWVKGMWIKGEKGGKSYSSKTCLEAATVSENYVISRTCHIRYIEKSKLSNASVYRKNAISSIYRKIAISSIYGKNAISSIYRKNAISSIY